MKSALFTGLALCLFCAPAFAALEDYPVVKLQSLDKVTARTMTFEARVGSTVKFGPIYIKIQACRKAPPIEAPESAAFLQVWENTPQAQSKWIYSGWMFASSPALSPMDHPIYDVWVLDCLSRKTGDPELKPDPAPNAAPDPDHKDDGEVTGAAAEPPPSVDGPVTDGPIVEGPGFDPPASDDPQVDPPSDQVDE